MSTPTAASPRLFRFTQFLPVGQLGFSVILGALDAWGHR